MCVLAMAGRMLPENHVNAKLSASIRAEDAARERRAVAEPSAAFRANGQSIVERLNRVANTSNSAPSSFASSAEDKATQNVGNSASKQHTTTNSNKEGSLSSRGMLPSVGPGSSNFTPPARELPARPTQKSQKVSAGTSSKAQTADSKTQKGKKSTPPRSHLCHFGLRSSG